MSSQRVCEYYLRGVCRFGERCRNEHPLLPDSQRATFGNQTWQASTNTNKVAFPYTAETLESDVTPMKDKPSWPLSSYGAAKFEPLLIGGLDESPEELRFKAVMAIKEGKVDEYIKYELEKTAAADQMYENVRNNIPQSYEQAAKLSQPSLSSANNIFGSSNSVFGGGSTFGNPGSSSTSPPSALGTTGTSAFGKPAFGQSVFGQSGFGAAIGPSSAFGQSSQSTSAFGSPSQPASAFAQPAQTTSTFGQPTQPTSVFGQPSAFGAVQPTSAFGQPSQPASAFGQPSQPTSVFGQPSQPTSAFGQSSLIKPASGAFGSTTPSTGAFGGGGGFSAFAGQPSSLTSAVAPSTTPSVPPVGSAFGQPGFGAAAPVQSAFAPATTQSVFGAPSQPVSALAPSSAFGGAPSGFPSSSPASAVGAGSPFATSPTTTVTVDTTATGPPDFALAKSRSRAKPGADRYAAFLPPNYMDILPAEMKAAFLGDRFEWGKIPEWIPPNEVR